MVLNALRFFLRQERQGCQERQEDKFKMSFLAPLASLALLAQKIQKI